jgi:hypothetical protein
MRKRKNRLSRGSSPTPRTIVRYKYKTRTKQAKRKRGGRRRSRGLSGAKIAAIGGVGVASAAIGALANEAGLLQAYPTQNKTGVSAVGWLGLTISGITLLFAKSEGAKILGYGTGGGMLTTELVRQIDMRGYDFDVAFNGAPALPFDPTPPRQLTSSEQSAADAFNQALLDSLKRE